MIAKQETFRYDALARLTTINHGVPEALAMKVDYEANGNIERKTNLGKYNYHATRKHAVETIENTGNLIPDKDQTITYTAFNKALQINETVGADAYQLDIKYGPDQQRWKTVLKKNNSVTKTTIFAGDYEKITDNGVTRELYYISGGDGLAAVYVKTGSSYILYYVHADHLGSIVKLTTATDTTAVFRATYDAWGRQTITKNTFKFHRGYTGHEHLPEFGLINMNGRMYDPIVGRFLSPDPFVQIPDFSQSFNRYSYCLNNPLIYTDPNGEFFFAAVGIGVFLNAACWGAAIGAATYTASVGFSDGGFNNWNWGNFGKSVGIGAISGAVTAGIGQMFGPVGSAGFSGELTRAYTHGFANGMISEFTGGDFMQGFASGGLGSLAGSAFMMYGGKFANSIVGNYAFSGLAGGIGAELTGGDFWQGAGIGLMTAGLNHLQSSLTRLSEKGWHTFKSEEEAYQYMWEASHKGEYAYKEHAAYVLKNGKVVLLPVDQNTSTGSNTFESLLTTNKDGTYTLKFKGKVTGYTHTHPGSTSMSVSGADKAFMNRFPNMTFKTIANKGIIYQVWSSGNYQQIGTIKK